MRSLGRLTAFLALGLLIYALVTAPLQTDYKHEESGIVAEAQSQNTRLLSIEWRTPGGYCPSPGDAPATLIISLQNTGPFNIPGIEAELALPPGFEEINGSSRIITYKPGPIPPGSVFTLEFNLRVKPGTPLGTHIAQLTLRAPSLFTETHDVELRIGPSPRIELLVETIPLAGVNQSIQLTLKNTGTGEARGLQLEITPPPSITLSPTVVNLGNLPPGKAKTINLTLDARAIPSPTTLNLQAKLRGYDECSGVWQKSYQVPLHLTLPRGDSLLITIEAPPLRAGEPSALTITLENTHATVVENTTLILTLPSYIALPGTPLPLNLGDLAPGEKKTITLPIEVSPQAPPTGSITATATYNLGSSTLSSKGTLYLSIDPPKQPRILVEASPLTPPTRGGETTFIITLRNQGEADAKSIRITLAANAPTVVKGESTYNVGNLAPGEEKQVTVTIITPANAPTALILRATASYEDPWGTPHAAEQTIAVPLDTRTPGELMVTLTPPGLQAGFITPVKARVTNTADKPLENVTITLSLPPAIRLAGVNTEWHIPLLPPGETAERTYYAYTLPQATGVETITVTLTYYSQGERREAVLPLGLPITSPQPPIITIQALNTTLTEASENRVILQVGNKGGQTAYNATLTLASPTAALHPQVITLGNLSPGSDKAVELTITPTDPGPLTLQATVTYQNQWGATAVQQASIGLRTLPQQPPPPPILILEATQEPLLPGEHKLVLKVMNPAPYQLESLTLAVNTPPGAPLSITLPQNPLLIGSLLPNSEKAVTINAIVYNTGSRAPASFTVSLSYWSPQTGPATTTATFTLTVDPTPLPQASVTVEPTVVRAGEPNTIKLTIENKGKTRWDNLELRLTQPPGSPLAIVGGTLRSLGQLDPGEQEVVELTVYPPLTTGDTLGMGVTLQFTVQGVPQTITDTITLLVRKPPLLQATEISIIPEDVKEGQPFSLSLTLSNTGRGTARNVFLEAQLPPGIQALSSPLIFVGDIMAGGSSTLTLSLQPQPGTSGEHVIRVRITYADNLEKTYEETLEVPVTITASSAGAQLQATTPLQEEAQGSTRGLTLPELAAATSALLLVAGLLFKLKSRRGE